MVQFKKTTIIIAVLLIVTSLSIGINIGLTWNQSTDHGSDNSSPTPSFTYSPTPYTTQPTITPTSTPHVNVSYSEVSLVENNDIAKLVLAVNATLVSGSSATLDCSNFSLAVYVPRGGLLPSYIGSKYYTATPQETGLKTVNSLDKTALFSLTFEFPTKGENFDDNVLHFSGYELQYSNDMVSIQFPVK
jgi:hypothetical protein